MAIRVNGIIHRNNTFDTAIDAAKYYDKFIIDNKLGRRLNFPNKEPDNLIPNTRLVRLTKGKFATVSSEDFEDVNKHLWCAIKHGHTYYAHRSTVINGKKIPQTMQHFLLGEGVIDHIDGDGLHNHRPNMRKCTTAQNNRNRLNRNFNKFKGVSYKSKFGWFEANICINYKPIYLGNFKYETDAAIAYDTAAIKYFGEFAKLNFISIKGEDTVILKNNKMTERNYNKSVLPIIKKLDIGESVLYPSTRSGSIRSMINNFHLQSQKRFQTRRSGNELIVTRVNDAEKIYE